MWKKNTLNVISRHTSYPGYVNITLDWCFSGLFLIEGRKEMFYLTTHSTHIVTAIWRRTYGKGPFR